MRSSFEAFDSTLWGWVLEARRPDAPSVGGAALALVGAAIIAYWPRA
jgi:small multidrug resistance family-3 protein